jgi:hypothetical protein
MRILGIEPRSVDLETTVLPLDDTPKMHVTGVEPVSFRLSAENRFTIKLHAQYDRSGTRTHEAYCNGA